MLHTCVLAETAIRCSSPGLPCCCLIFYCLLSSYLDSHFEKGVHWLNQYCLQALDRWEERLEMIWEGKPYDILDAALADTVARFPVHIQPFRDMIGGMRIDLIKSRYRNFEELYEYMYR